MNKLTSTLSRQPFILILASTIIGILIGFREMSIVIPISMILLACLILVYLLLRSNTPSRSLRLRSWHWLWVSLIFTGIGMFCSSLQYPQEIDLNDEIYTSHAIATISDIETTTTGDRLIVTINHFQGKDGSIHDTKDFKALITTSGTTLKVGDCISFMQDFQPINDSKNYQHSDFASYMLHNGIRYRQYCDVGDIYLIGHHSNWKSLSVSIRNNLVAIVENSSLQKPTQHFIITMLLGDKDFMTEQVNQKFSDGGIAHILALSGLHLGIISLILTILLYPLRLITSPKTTYFIIIIALWSFAYITGLSPSVVRSAIMATFFFTSLIIERHNDSINSLLAAVTFIILIDPLSLFNIGLQLSATTVASIILLTNKINFINRFRYPRLHKTLSSVITTLTAVLGSWMITVHYFHNFPLMFLPINAITIPLLPLYMGVAIAHIIFSACGLDFALTTYLLDNGYTLLINFIDLLTFEGSVIENVWISPIAMPFYFAFIILLSLALSNRDTIRYIYAAIFLGLSVIVALTLPSNSPLDGFIIQDHWSSNMIRVYYNGCDSIYEIPRYVNAHTTIYDQHIISIDNHKMTNRMIDNVANSDSTITTTRPCDFLVICKGYRGNITDLLLLYNPKTIVLMPEIFDTKEKALVREGKNMNVNIHSISEDGALQYLIKRN